MTSSRNPTNTELTQPSSSLPACVEDFSSAWAAPDTFDLRLAGPRQNLLNEVEALLQEGFEGIYYDFEPVADGDPAFLQLLEETRARFPHMVLSVATPQLKPPGLPAPSQLWSLSYYREVALRCDQVVLMGYDTLQPTSWMYSHYLAHQVRELTTLPAQFMVGLPCYDDNAPYHNAGSETLAAGIQGARAGGAQRLAIYCEWTCDQAEWQQWKDLWIKPDQSN